MRVDPAIENSQFSISWKKRKGMKWRLFLMADDQIFITGEDRDQMGTYQTC